MERNGLVRRRCTTEKKPVNFEKARDTLRKHQEKCLAGGFNYDTICNMDETGVNFAILPKFQYVPQDASRAHLIPGSDEKLRITAALTVRASGEFLPTFLILKHSELKDPTNEMGTKVLKDLHSKGRFTAQEG